MGILLHQVPKVVHHDHGEHMACRDSQRVVFRYMSNVLNQLGFKDIQNLFRQRPEFHLFSNVLLESNGVLLEEVVVQVVQDEMISRHVYV